MTCIVVWDKTIIDRNQMRAVLDDAGKLVGLGDGRSILPGARRWKPAWRAPTWTRRSGSVWRTSCT
jgi:hypothetical protein